MAKITLPSVTSGYASSTKVEAGFNQIEQEFQDKVLYRDNTSGEANHMETSLDMNSNRVYNLPTPASQSDAARLADVTAAIAGLPTLTSDLIIHAASGGGAVSRNAQEKLRELGISVEDYGGGVAKTAAENSAAIAAASTAASIVGGNVLFPNAGIYWHNGDLEIPRKQYWIGSGSNRTELKLANGRNVRCIHSVDYDTLVGSDIHRIVDGNAYAFGLVGLKINGNKANNTSGDGVQFYGKHVLINDVIITQCAGEGYHHEGNANIPGAPDPEGNDMPEGCIRDLRVIENGSHGAVFRGQHDSFIESLFSAVNDGWGVRFESAPSTLLAWAATTNYSLYDLRAPTVANGYGYEVIADAGSSAGTEPTWPTTKGATVVDGGITWQCIGKVPFSGNMDSNFMHVYANTAGGVLIGPNTMHQCQFMISESNFGVGLECLGWQSKIGMLQLYINCRTTGDYQARIAGFECAVNFHAKTTASGKYHVQVAGHKNKVNGTIIGSSTDGSAGNVSGISVTGQKNQVDVIVDGNGNAGNLVSITGGKNIVHATIDGSVGTGVGLVVSGFGQTVSGRIDGLSGGTGVGLSTGWGAQLLSSNIAVNISDCKTLWDNASAGSLNIIDITGQASAGQVVKSGSGASTNEQWRVNAYDADTTKNIYSYDYPLRSRVIAQSGAALSHTGNTNETSLAVVDIPADLLGLNGSILVHTQWSYTSSGNNKTLRTRFGADGSAATHAGTAHGAVVLTTGGGYSEIRKITNRNAANSQIGPTAAVSGGLSSGGALVTSAIDTTAITEIEFSAQLASAGETITLESYLVEVIPS